MTNHPIAEQDSLEGLIARLRSEGQLLDQLARTLTRGKSRVSQAGDACREAADTIEALQEALAETHNDRAEQADTLSQMRDALEKAESFFVGVPFQTEARECLATIQAALTTTKIEKE